MQGYCFEGRITESAKHSSIWKQDHGDVVSLATTVGSPLSSERQGRKHQLNIIAIVIETLSSLIGLSNQESRVHKLESLQSTIPSYGVHW